jgi:PAS domain S-box-containing protein
MDPSTIVTLLISREDWLMQRILAYSKANGYTRFTSTLAEAWRASVAGLSTSLIQTLNAGADLRALTAEEDYTQDPVAAFGILQAQRHRSRGVTLGMFLGLMKYFRQTYLDLLEEGELALADRSRARRFLDLFFDRVELGFCTEWSRQDEQVQLQQLQLSNRQLTNEKNLYLTLFESLHAPVLFFGPDHRLVNFNHAAAQLFARTATPGECYYGTPTRPMDLSWLGQRLEGISEHHPEDCFTTRLARPGGLAVFQVRLKRMLDFSEKFLGTVVLLEDVSELKAAEETLGAARDFYLRLFEDFPALIWRAGLDGRCNYFNRTWLEFTGRSLGQELGEGWTEGVHPEDLDRCLGLYQESFAARRPFSMEYRLRHHSGSYHWINNIGRPFFDFNDDFAGYIVTCHDITEARQYQERLNALLQELKRSNQELEHFAYVASHDLQEPLRMVTSYLQLLARRYEGHLDQDADDFIGFAVDGARRMEVLIKDLLGYSRVESRGRPLQPTDCRQQLANALQNLEICVAESGAQVRVGELPLVLADPGQLTQLFQNLIHNAIKFRGDAPPQVGIEARAQGESWVIRVCDNGIGIPPAHRERVFQVFQRLHPIGSYPGTGIGLAVCKKIVERHGGTIWIEEAEPQGTCFHFTLKGVGTGGAP